MHRKDLAWCVPIVVLLLSISGCFRPPEGPITNEDLSVMAQCAHRGHCSTPSGSRDLDDATTRRLIAALQPIQSVGKGKLDKEETDCTLSFQSGKEGVLFAIALSEESHLRFDCMFVEFLESGDEEYGYFLHEGGDPNEFRRILGGLGTSSSEHSRPEEDAE